MDFDNVCVLVINPELRAFVYLPGKLLQIFVLIDLRILSVDYFINKLGRPDARRFLFSVLQAERKILEQFAKLLSQIHSQLRRNVYWLVVIFVVSSLNFLSVQTPKYVPLRA